MINATLDQTGFSSSVDESISKFSYATNRCGMFAGGRVGDRLWIYRGRRLCAVHECCTAYLIVAILLCSHLWQQDRRSNWFRLNFDTASQELVANIGPMEVTMHSDTLIDLKELFAAGFGRNHFHSLFSSSWFQWCWCPQLCRNLELTKYQQLWVLELHHLR